MRTLDTFGTSLLPLIRSAALSMLILLLGAVPARDALAAAASLTALADDAVTVDYDAPSVGLRLRYVALLPDGYAGSDTRYPVLYLLHGHTGYHRSWLDYAKLATDAATRLGAIIVLVDGGNTFYVNWQGAEETRPQRWEDALIHDLMPAVDRRWRTRAERAGRAVGGLSMGGYGAVTIALRHPDLFAAAFSSAGALRFAERAREEIRSGKDDWNRPELWSKEEYAPVPIAGFATQRERTPRGRVFVDPVQTDAYDPFVLAQQIDPARAPHIHLDCGLQDALLPETLALAAALAAHGLRHSLTVLPGEHEVPYWANAFEHTLLIFKPLLAASTPAGDRPDR